MTHLITKKKEKKRQISTWIYTTGEKGRDRKRRSRRSTSQKEEGKGGKKKGKIGEAKREMEKGKGNG